MSEADEAAEAEGVTLEFPWDYQQVAGHDLVEVFKDAWYRAQEMGAENEDAITSGLMEVFRVLAWELHDLPLPPDPLDRRTLMAQHVLHRVGDQGNGN